MSELLAEGSIQLTQTETGNNSADIFHQRAPADLCIATADAMPFKATISETQTNTTYT